MAAGGQENNLEQVCIDHIRNESIIELQQKWINPNADLQRETLAMFPMACENHGVFTPRTGKRPKNTVVICSIQGTPYEHLYDTANVAIYAGGPGSR